MAQEDKAPYENYIKSPFYRIFFNLLLAGAIFSGSTIAVKLMGLHGTFLTILWPSTGISLAALLLFGYQVWIGVFLGNFFFSTLQLITDNAFITPITLGALISIISTFQALVGAYLIRNISSPGYLSNLREVIQFLLFGGAITCLIVPTLTVPLLIWGGYVPWDAKKLYWQTLWYGDTIGVYLITPLILEWSLHKIGKISFGKAIEAFVIFLCFLFVFYLTLIMNYPLNHLLIPLILWVLFRFGPHGTTLALFFVTYIVIIGALLGYGPMATYSPYPYVLLVTYTGGLVMLSLLLLGTLHERKRAWDMLLDYNANLENTIQQRTKQINEMHERFNLKQKLISLGILAVGIGNEIKAPLKVIRDNTKGVKDCIVILSDLLKYNKFIDKKLKTEFEDKIKTLDNSVDMIDKLEKQANNVVSVIKQTTEIETKFTAEFKSINFPIFITRSIEQKKLELDAKYPGLHVSLEKEISPTIKDISGIPEDLLKVLTQILNNSWYAMQKKKEILGEKYQPICRIKVMDRLNAVEIDIFDNGIGIPPKRLTKIFQPFYTSKSSGEGVGLSMSIIHDIIVQGHNGSIFIDSKEGEYTEIKINLPK